jgi:hypothetical protein
MSAIRAKLEAIKKKKVSAIKKEKSASDSVHQLLASLTKPDKAPVRNDPPRLQRANPRQSTGKGWGAVDLIKKLIGVLQATQANHNPKAKTQEWDPDDTL